MTDPTALQGFALENKIMPPVMATAPAGLDLPAIKPLADSLTNPPPEMAELVPGLIHAGTKVLLSASSKGKKTWSLLALAIAISLGIEWWGFKTTKGRVLYVNFEVHECFLVKRAAAILAALGHKAARELDFWHLRGWSCPARMIIPEIAERVKAAAYSMIIIDPTYKLMGGLDENSASAIGEVLNAFEALAVETGAAIVFAAHFSKGNQASKEAIDRVSGSGVFGRDPDTILTLTQHAEADAFTVQPILRNFPPVDAFALRWEHPLMHRADDLDPDDLKRPVSRRSPAKNEPTLEEFVAIFPNGGGDNSHEAVLSTQQISKIFIEKGWDKGCMVGLRESARDQGLLEVRRGAHNRFSIARPEIFEAIDLQGFPPPGAA